jgi:uncharacterized lipoprotein YddW (UPF0748 family)
MRLRLAACLAALLGLVSQPAAAEVRGLWIVRTALESPASVDRVVDQAQAAGFNALFVQVRGRGDAYYESGVVLRSPLLAGQPRGFDPLAQLLARARGRGLQVHAWVNVLLAAHFTPLPAGHVLERHPEWLMVPKSVARAALAPRARIVELVREAGRAGTDVEGFYLSPAAHGVPEHLESVVRELLRGYAVDGLHFDFIRYPSLDYDHSRAALEGFARQKRWRGELPAAPAADPEAWARYRRDVLSALADRLARAARSERPGTVISAAVVPDEATAVHVKGQAWPAWLSRGILDAVCPMSYTPDSALFAEQVRHVRALAGASGRTLWAGIGSYRLTVEGTIEKIGLARDAGANGVVLFSHESFGPADYRRLREVAFLPPARAGARGVAGGSGRR